MRATKQQLLNELVRLQRRIDEFERSVDQHHRVKQASPDSTEQLRLVVENLPALISYVDNDQRYRFVNNAYEKWFGARQEDVVGRNAKEVLGKAAYAVIEKYIAKALAGELVTYQATVPYKHGGERHIDATYVPDLTQDGKVRGFFVLVHDITEHKRTEEALRKARDELERRVEERTTKLKTVNTQLLEEITERKRAEEALVGAHRELVDAIESIPASFILYDADGRMSRWNTQAREMFSDVADGFAVGTRIADFSRARYQIAMPDASGERVEEAVQARLDKFHHPGEAFQERLPDGRWTEAFERRTSDGGTVCVRMDITERKRAEEDIYRLSLRNELILNSAGEGIYGLDLEGRTTFVNPAAARMIGWDSDDLIGQRQHDILHHSKPDGSLYPRDECPIYAAFRDGTVHQVADEVFWRKDGTSFPVEYMSTPILEDGKPVGAVVVFRDITERKRAEAELERTQFALDHASDATFWIDRDGCMVYANTAACIMLGYSREELLTLCVPDYDPNASLDDFSRAFERIKARGSYTFEAHHRTKAGIDIPVEVSVHYMRFGDDELMCSYARNIAKRKELEAQFRGSQKLEALGQLTGGVAHEFNNLMQAIVGSLDVIKDEVQDSDRAKRMIELAQRSAFRGKDLTGRLLSYVGKQPVTPEVVDVGEFVSDSVDLLEPMLGETIEIETQIAGDLWPIKVDREQLEVAALNLAVNARDAISDGGTLTIEAANAHIDEALAAKHPYSVDPGDYVKLAVTDTGAGMPQEVKDRVFDPFFTTKEVGKGTGLGLSMVFGFVRRQSGGFIDITSEEGRGTTVALYLPRAEAKKAEASQPAEGSKEPSTGAGTILVVEDNPAVLDTMAFMLEGLGYTVLKAKDGAEALTVLEQAGVIDLLLADVILPGGTSGIELADTVRRANSATKVIVMSGYPEDEFDTTALSEAGIRLLKKPFRKRTLASVIEEALGSGSKQGA